MPTIKQSLHGQDLRFLQIVAQNWGVSLQAPDARQALSQLVKVMLDPQTAIEIHDALPSSSQQALLSLIQHKGRLPWTQFSRQFGDVREMGSGRRDREQPHLDPISPAESLWYHGFLARAFFDTPSGPLEHAYIPTDMLNCLESGQSGITVELEKTTSKTPPVLGRPASLEERAHTMTVSDRILDHACTYLAALRTGVNDDELNAIAIDWMIPLPTLIAFLQAMGILDESGLPEPEATRQHLQASRSQALVEMTQSWLQSSELNDLRQIPHLRAEGKWHNDPLNTRKTILKFLDLVPVNTWWGLTSFVLAIKEIQPDFQRTAGEYDTWYLWDQRDERFLRGFSHWDDVEGNLIRYVITGPMHWLGLTDLASHMEGEPPTAFRISTWAQELRNGTAPNGVAKETETLHVRAKGQISIPRFVPRDIRYQISRFCHWEGEKGVAYRLRITSSSLMRAQNQGLNPNHLLVLLRRHADKVPPNILKALKNWEKRGAEARFERVSVLRLATPALLKKLRGSEASRYLGDTLGPTSVIVKPGRWEQLQSTLTEMGYLSEITFAIGEKES